MLPGWSSDPYVIVKLCEKKEELEKFQTKTVGNESGLSILGPGKPVLVPPQVREL